MAEIVKGLTNLVQSFFQIIYGTVSTVVSTIVNTLEAAFNFVVGIFQSAFNVSEGIVGLVLGNLTLILTAVLAYWGYVIYQQRQGNKNPQPLKEISGKVQKMTS
ncbi:uncharacterized protein HMPREF1541_10840 [Cyphellophora europaea CBS 101466]|uniref:Uncharacterized protein n=1 Tax=Cyphellophora europaea (strain CBS 101466) TaxID=1220924 RepID=W2S5T9_CYPE1|nr:uncharacterized protein HMPREF1541_10840 [Cyphellophora europaea CBS 101466]ETN43975.1 hypothetical protein HMPREF1541_10840 [Cyphellophora europaea CBS 101466]